MTEPLEALYTDIGQTIVNLMMTGWVEVSIHVYVKPGVIQLKCFSMDADENRRESFLPDQTLAKLFGELHERMVLELKNDWTTADFQIKRDGEFSVSFGYEREEVK